MSNISKNDSGLYKYEHKCSEQLRFFIQNNYSLEIPIDKMILIKYETQDSVTIFIDMRKALKKYGLIKYRNEIQMIHQHITGINLPVLGKNEYGIVMKMCEQSMSVYSQKIRPFDRVGLLGLKFVLRKILYLINRDDVGEYFDTFCNKKKDFSMK